MEKLITVQMTDEEAIYFRECQRDYYWNEPLKKEIRNRNMKNGQLTVVLHFTNLGEVGSFDVIERSSHLKMLLPI